MWMTPLLPVLYTSVHIRSQTQMVIRYVGVIISIGFCVMCTVHAYCTLLCCCLKVTDHWCAATECLSTDLNVKQDNE